MFSQADQQFLNIFAYMIGIECVKKRNRLYLAANYYFRDNVKPEVVYTCQRNAVGNSQ